MPSTNDPLGGQQRTDACRLKIWCVGGKQSNLRYPARHAVSLQPRRRQSNLRYPARHAVSLQPRRRLGKVAAAPIHFRCPMCKYNNGAPALGSRVIFFGRSVTLRPGAKANRGPYSSYSCRSSGKRGRDYPARHAVPLRPRRRLGKVAAIPIHFRCQAQKLKKCSGSTLFGTLLLFFVTGRARLPRALEQ